MVAKETNSGVGAKFYGFATLHFDCPLMYMPKAGWPGMVKRLGSESIVVSLVTVCARKYVQCGTGLSKGC